MSQLLTSLSLYELSTTDFGGKRKEVDYSSVEIDGVDTGDYPDFCDAYVCYAEYEDGEELTDEDYEKLNDDRDFVSQHAYDKLF